MRSSTSTPPRPTGSAARYQALGWSLRRSRPMRFKAKDGLELTGYLTCRDGATPKNLPLVVFPHGGPAARDSRFDWWAQAMASRGYAVLQVEFPRLRRLRRTSCRPASASGAARCRPTSRTASRYLAGQGIVDPKRVCIVGASYGGYAALAGATLDTGVYRCAVAVAGVADLAEVWSPSATTAATSGVAARRYWMRFMGADSARRPAPGRDLAGRPRRQGRRVPILLIHGKDDTVVPLEQSQIMADALKRAGKPVELVILDGERPLAVARRNAPGDAAGGGGLPGEEQPAGLTATGCGVDRQRLVWPICHTTSGEAGGCA